MGINWAKHKTGWKVEDEPEGSGDVFSWNTVRTNPSPGRPSISCLWKLL